MTRTPWKNSSATYTEDSGARRSVKTTDERGRWGGGSRKGRQGEKGGSKRGRAQPIEQILFVTSDQYIGDRGG